MDPYAFLSRTPTSYRGFMDSMPGSSHPVGSRASAYERLYGSAGTPTARSSNRQHPGPRRQPSTPVLRGEPTPFASQQRRLISEMDSSGVPMVSGVGYARYEDFYGMTSRSPGIYASASSAPVLSREEELFGTNRGFASLGGHSSAGGGEFGFEDVFGGDEGPVYDYGGDFSVGGRVFASSSRSCAQQGNEDLYGRAPHRQAFASSSRTPGRRQRAYDFERDYDYADFENPQPYERWADMGGSTWPPWREQEGEYRRGAGYEWGMGEREGSRWSSW